MKYDSTKRTALRCDLKRKTNTILEPPVWRDIYAHRIAVNEAKKGWKFGGGIQLSTGQDYILLESQKKGAAVGMD